MLRCAGVIAVVVLALTSELASAHGPCGCLTPREAAPGTKVHAAYPVYKIVFNPDRADLGIGPERLWRQHHGGPPVTVLRRTWRYSERPLNDGGTFVVPRVAPGRYLVALYDGGEGGAHYSWETLTVVGAEPTPSKQAPTRARSSSGGVALPLFIGAVAASLLAGLAAGAALHKRRHPAA